MAHSTSRLLGLMLASALSAFGCAQIFGLERAEPCTSSSDCPTGQSCAGDLCVSAAAGQGSGSAGVPGGSAGDFGSSSGGMNADAGATSSDNAGADGSTDGRCAGNYAVGDSVVCSASPDGTQISFPSGKPQGTCKVGRKVCEPSGSFGPCQGAIAPAQTDCTSAADHNCDGKPDNGQCGVCKVGDTQDCYDGPAGTSGVGPCKGGTQTCELDASGRQTVWGACMGQTTPADNDTCEPGNDATCNGRVNEGCACVNGETGACGAKLGSLGSCAAGVTHCVDGAWGACSITPAAADTCDAGNDATCNGRVNEGCGCTNGQTQGCGSTLMGCTPGTATCQNGSFVNCTGGCGDFTVFPGGTCTATGPKGEDTEVTCTLSACAAGYHVTDCSLTASGGASCSFSGASSSNRSSARVTTDKPTTGSSASCSISSCSCHADGF